jgi:hypothetical protein
MVSVSVRQRGIPVAGVLMEWNRAAVLSADEVNVLDSWCHGDCSSVGHVISVCLEDRVDFRCAHFQ